MIGEIPSSIGGLINLERLYLNENQLTGSIPVEIGELTNLTHLYLSDNQLSGQIPIEICEQGDSSPELENNNLCPPYPDCILEHVGSQNVSDCVECSLGDINNDLNLDILDVVLVIDIIINESNYNDCVDMNNDNIIDILDIILIVNMIMDS